MRVGMASWVRYSPQYARAEVFNLNANLCLSRLLSLRPCLSASPPLRLSSCPIPSASDLRFRPGGALPPRQFCFCIPQLARLSGCPKPWSLAACIVIFSGLSNRLTVVAPRSPSCLMHVHFYLVLVAGSDSGPGLVEAVRCQVDSRLF